MIRLQSKVYNNYWKYLLWLKPFHWNKGTSCCHTGKRLAEVSDWFATYQQTCCCFAFSQGSQFMTSGKGTGILITALAHLDLKGPPTRWMETVRFGCLLQSVHSEHLCFSIYLFFSLLFGALMQQPKLEHVCAKSVTMQSESEWTFKLLEGAIYCDEWMILIVSSIGIVTSFSKWLNYYKFSEIPAHWA